MSSKNKGQRKRKSAGVGDIFEVNEKDLSPEPEVCDTVEPEAKVLKTRNSDVSESRRNSEQHNLKNEEVESTKSSKILTESHKNEAVSEENVITIDLSDTPKSERDDIQVTEDLPQEAEQISRDSDADSIVKSYTKGRKKKIGPTVSSSVSSHREENTKTTEINTKNNNVSGNSTEEILTIVDDQEDSQDDVIMVCDSSIDLSTEAISSQPQIINDDTLEDGEVNDNTFEEPDTSLVTSIPSITVTFSDESVADIYKLKFCKFIQSFVELEVQNVNDTTINVFRDTRLDPKEWVVLDETVCINKKEEECEEELAKLLPVTPKIETPKKKKKKKKQQQQDKTELFVVDTNPGAGAHKPVLTKYSTKFLINDVEKQEVDPKAIIKPSYASICFNCEKEHALKDCPNPKNYGKISANRQKFQNKNKSSRYHLEEDQKYAHLVPGKISPGLKKALGLKKHQIPSYVYQMRIIGYPPGWLEEAKFVSSDLAMFDLDGKNVKHANFDKIKGLDPEKIVEYPGFNVPFENNFKDEHKYHRVPPFCDQFSKKNMIDVFNKLSQREEDDFQTQDMDLDNTNDSLTEDATKLQNKQLGSSIDSDSNNEPSISELEKVKYTLLAEIKKSSETIPWEQPLDDTSQSNTDEGKSEEAPKEEDSKNEEETSEKEDLEEEEAEQVIIESKSTETQLKITVSEDSEINDSSSPLNAKTNINCVKHSVFGTPIIKGSSPYARLPNSDNFTVGVSPVIDFENLPNSTGKYEKLTGVLQKVRNTLKSLQNPKT